MRQIFPIALTAITLATVQLDQVAAQTPFTNQGLSGWFSTGTAANGLAVGNQTIWPFPQGAAFQVRGDLMPTSTGEVFRTDAPAGQVTYWRMFRDGTEMGNLSSSYANSHFDVSAEAGQLRLFTYGSTSNTLLRNMIRLNRYQTSTINSFVMNTDGFAGIGKASGLVGGAGPWTRLHLADELGPVIDFGFRSWMRNGITMTGNGDQMYVGMKYNGTDLTDAVIQWSDNSGPNGPDNMRFL